MSEISKAYNPSEVEDKWYKTWVESGCFKGKVDPNKEAYSIVIPPPNVTGVLTMGHVLNNTIQDILVRRARQTGKSAIWFPAPTTRASPRRQRWNRTCARKNIPARASLGATNS